MNNFTRRKFLITGSAAASGMILGLKKDMLSDIEMRKGDKIRIGIIGIGNRGSSALKAAQEVPGLDLVACCDILPENLSKALKLTGKKIEVYTDYKRLLENKTIDAVIIATPLYLHYSMAIDAIGAGKHVYCEKTMTYSIEQAIHLTEKVKQSKLVFQIGYQHRFNPVFQKVQKFIADSNCGEITHITCSWNRNSNWRRYVPDPKLECLINWRMYKEYSGGLIAELCSHQIDLINWILNGHPKKVTGFGGIDYWKDGRETYDNVNVLFEYPKGVKAQLSALTTNAHEGFSMKFYGTKATIEVKGEEEQQAVVFPELRKEDADQFNIDALTGATRRSLDPDLSIPLLSKEEIKTDHAIFIRAFTHFENGIRNNVSDINNAESAKQSAIAVHIANAAIEKGTVEYWKESYSD